MPTIEQPCVVLCERLTIDEEADFLTMVNDAVASGELTDDEASQMIDREYALLAAMAR